MAVVESVNIMDKVAVTNTAYTEISIPDGSLGGVDIQLDTGNAFKFSFSEVYTDTVNGALDAPINLSYGAITDVVVTSADGLTTYAVTTDYTYTAGDESTLATITLLSTGSMLASTDYLVSYTYYPYFRGVPGLTMNQNLSKRNIYIKAEEATANALVMYYTEKR
jgi:uncharacterized protein YcfL